MSDDLDRLKSALADRYVIECELGQGGMATVYLAEDAKHHRKVAVKVLRPELSAVLGTERFQREIAIAASLNHPNIVQLLDSGIAEEQPSARPPDGPSAFLYYAMPYIEGETLRDRLNREKQLSIDDSLKVAEQVASALEYAHRRDVIHRDIKPENILFHEGVAMVADFGIALAVKSAGGDRLTETGMSLGTPAYMSPEQVAGDRDIDGRSDIYSLACVLYEMLAGDPPFVASNPQAILAKHVTDPAPPITTVRSSVPQPVATAIAKALGKARADRFESAKEFSEALFAEAADAEPEIKSIVVLPFENLSPDPDDAFFADGLTEELIASLSKIQAFLVISRTTAMLLKGSKKDVPTIARDLNVRYVLEGSVRRAGNNLRITAQLIEAVSDVHLWADAYSGTMEDIFGIQEQVARAIAGALAVTLDARSSARLAERPITNAAAYDCYIRAIQSMWVWTKPALARAVEHLEHGIEIEGHSAQLHGALAYIYYQHVNAGIEPTGEYRRRTRQATHRAFALNPKEPFAHLAIGLLSAFEDPAEGIRAFKQVLTDDPTNVEALVWLGAVSGQSWRPEVGQGYMRRALILDPLHPVASFGEGMLLMFAGDFRGAEGLLRKNLRVERSPMLIWVLAETMGYLDRREEACLLFDEAYQADPDGVWYRIGKALRHALAGEGEAAQQLLRNELDASTATHRDYTYALWLAECHALLGDTDGAFEWLERSVGLGMINYPLLNEYDPHLTPLRGEPRFRQLMEKVKKEWEEFEV